MSHESSDFEDIDLGTEDRGAALIESVPTEAEGTPTAPTEHGDLQEPSGEAARPETSGTEDQRAAGELNTPNGPSALEGGDEAEWTDTLEEDLRAALAEDEPEVEATNAPEASTLDTTVPELTDDAAASSTPTWDRISKLNFGPLNDEDADMNLEAAERRTAEEARGSDYNHSPANEADINPEAAARTSAEAARGYYYENRPRTPYEGSSDDALVLYSPRIHWDWVINRRYKPTDAELRAVPVRANGATSPLRQIRNVEDGFSPEPSPELDKLPPLPGSPGSPTSPAESWEAFKSNTGEEEDVEPDTKSQEELFEELFGPEGDANVDAKRDGAVDDDPVSDAEPASETAGRLHISTSDVELRQPTAIRPQIQTQTNVDDLLPDDEEEETDEPKTPPSAEVLATMTNMTPEESFHLLEQTYEQLQRCGFPDPADTLQLKRKLFFHERDRLKYNGFTDRYLEQIQAGPASSKKEEPEKYENEVKAKEMFNNVAAQLYRQQREEYRHKLELADDRRMDDEYNLEQLQQRAQEDEYEISMLKHKVDSLQHDLTMKTREAEGWKQGFERNAQFAKDAYDRRQRLEEEGDEEEEEEDAKKTKTKDTGTQVFLPVSESKYTQKPRLRGSQTESEVDFLKRQNAELQRNNEQMQEREMKLSADYRESQRRLRNADEVWQMIPDEIENATEYVDALSRQRYIAEDENKKTKEENERLKKILNEYVRFEEGRKKKEQEAESAQAPQAVSEPTSTQPSDTLPVPSTFAPPAPASSLPATAPSTVHSSDLSQYFMSINPAAPPPPSPFPQTQNWLALEAEIRQLNSYKQNRAAFLRQYKLQYERRLMESEGRWKRRVTEGLVLREEEQLFTGEDD